MDLSCIVDSETNHSNPISINILLIYLNSVVEGSDLQKSILRSCGNANFGGNKLYALGMELAYGLSAVLVIHIDAAGESCRFIYLFHDW